MTRRRIRAWMLHLVEPLIIPRWLLLTKYLLFVLMGSFAIAYGVPTLTITTGAVYPVLWSIGLTASAALAAFGCLRLPWEPLERIGALGVTAILAGYSIGACVIALNLSASGMHQAAAARAVFCVALLIITLLPGSRAAWLLTRVGLGRHRRHGRHRGNE